MKEQIDTSFRDNISRVKNMVSIYQTHIQGSGRGRRGHLQTDILRASTVFLHASLEDLLRSLSRWKLPLADKETIDSIPITGMQGRAAKFFLGELTKHRGKTINTVIEESVKEYLERSNYNDTTEISYTLNSINIDPEDVNDQFSNLEELMRRRHQIVHRADVTETAGSGNHRINTISVAQVNNWIFAVEEFGLAVLNEVDE